MVLTKEEKKWMREYFAKLYDPKREEEKYEKALDQERARRKVAGKVGLKKALRVIRDILREADSCGGSMRRYKHIDEARGIIRLFTGEEAPSHLSGMREACHFMKVDYKALKRRTKK
jgi:hypothetical protein